MSVLDRLKIFHTTFLSLVIVFSIATCVRAEFLSTVSERERGAAVATQEQPSDGRVWGKPTEDYVLGVATNKQHYLPGETIVLTATFKSVGTEVGDLFSSQQVV